MVKGKKAIVLARHGEHKNNVLTPEAIEQAYETGISLIEKCSSRGVMGIVNSFILHSGQQRTIDTGKKLIEGIFGLYDPVPLVIRADCEIGPLFFKNLAKNIKTRKCSLLGYEDIEYNEKALDEKYEEYEYMKIWTANPDSTDFEGQQVTCYNEMLRRGKTCLSDTINEMFSDSQNLAILSTYMTITEPIFMAGVNSARKTPCTLDDIGGVFETGECATLIFGKDKHDKYTKSEFLRRDKSYDVNLDRLLAICEE